MLKRLDNKTVEGPGYKVVVPDIHSVIYNEGRNSITIEIEGGTDANGVNWLVYVKTLSVQEVDSSYIMTKEKREIILKRISDALNLLDMPHRLEM